MNFTEYLSEVRKGVTTLKLTNFGETLNETARDIIADPMPMTEAEVSRVTASLYKHR